MEGKPTLNELITHVDVGTEWLRLGVLLELDIKDLNAIGHVRPTINERLQYMYALWLEENPNATRGQLIKALGVIKANTLAYNYKEWISSTARATATSKDTNTRRHSSSVSKQRECQTDSPQQEVTPAIETRGSTQEEEKQLEKEDKGGGECQTDSPQQEVTPAIETRGSTQEEEEQSEKEDRGGVRKRTHVDQSQQQQQLASQISQTKKGGFLENYRKEIGFTLMIIIIIIFLSFILYCFPDFKGPIIGAFVTIAIGALSALVNHCLKSNVPGSADIKIEPLTTLTQST